MKTKASTTNCENCGAKLFEQKFLCLQCWIRVPPKERASYRTMECRQQDTYSKREKILNLLLLQP